MIRRPEGSERTRRPRMRAWMHLETSWRGGSKILVSCRDALNIRRIRCRVKCV